MHDPVLQLDQFGLQPEQFTKIELAVKARPIFRRMAKEIQRPAKGVIAVVVQFQFQFLIKVVQPFGRNASGKVV